MNREQKKGKGKRRRKETRIYRNIRGDVQAVEEMEEKIREDARMRGTRMMGPRLEKQKGERQQLETTRDH